MPADGTADMLVVIDSQPGSLAGLQIAQRYGQGAIVLSAWDAPALPAGTGATLRSSVAAEPSIAEAFRIAAQEHISWLAVRRDLAPPAELLGEILVATGQHTDDDLPGFAVFLADGEPAAFQRILAIVDRRSGPISGLLAHAAVAVADTARAVLDVLVIGARGEALASEDRTDLLAINREEELLDRAVARAVESGLTVNWLPAAEVTDPWLVVRDQLSQHDYDLVVDDLGDLQLGGRLGLKRTLREAMGPGQVGELPLRLLGHTTLPLLLVVDEIRLGIAPRTVLKAGAVAALSLGMVSAAALSVSAPTVHAAPNRNGTDPVDDLVADLTEALDEAGAGGAGGVAGTGSAADSADVTERTRDVQSTSRGGSDVDSARAIAMAANAVSVEAVTPTVYGDRQALAASKQSDAEKGSQEPPDTGKAETAPKAPKGGAKPADVAKASRAASKAKKALVKEKEQRTEAVKAAEAATAALGTATADAHVALAGLQSAASTLEESSSQAADLHSDTTGLQAVLPGGATPEEAQAAADAAAAAHVEQEEAIDSAKEALDELTAAQAEAASAEETLAEIQAAVQERKASYQQAKATVEVYRESLGESRQAPVAKGDYRLTARYGDRGYHWSSGRHTGLDFAGSTGTRVTAAASGKVVEAGWAGAYGNRIVIDHGDGYQTTYNHLSAISTSVGDKVRTGEQIGRLGGTGNVTGPHLHFEVMKGESFVDPAAWLGW